MPKLRTLPKAMIQDFEAYFIKEQVTYGYRLLGLDEQQDYLYFITRGFVKAVFPVDEMQEIFSAEAIIDAEK